MEYLSDDALTNLLLISLVVLTLVSIRFQAKTTNAIKALKKKKKKKSLLKKILKYLYTGVFYNLSKLVPRSKKIVVFGAESGLHFAGNPKYLFLEMQNRGVVRCIWITKTADTLLKMREKGYECYFANSFKGIYFQLRAKTVILSHSIVMDLNRVCVGGAVSVNTWHGVGLKKVWFQNKSSFAYKALNEPNPLKRMIKMMMANANFTKENYVISTSDAVSAYYPSTFNLDRKYILQLGQARNDVFFDSKLEEGNIPKFLKEEKIITYMPTHRNYGKGKKEINIDECLDYEKLNQFCKDNNCYFVIKKHIHLKSTPLRTNYERVIDISNSGVDPQVLLKYTDVLITDYSSCYTDYLLLDRPVVFYVFDYDDYVSNMRDLYFEFDEVTPGPKVREFDDLIETLQQIMNGADTFGSERERVKNIFYSKDNQGPVTKKQVDYILQNIIKV